MRQQIQAACASFFLGVADRAVDSSSGAVCLAPVLGDVESRLSPHFLSDTGQQFNSLTS
jgi:hypothetical protein